MRRSFIGLGRLASACLTVFGWVAGSAQAATSPKLTVAGPEEVVVSSETMGCKPRSGRAADISDIPPSAFRREDGTVVLIAGNRRNWYFEGRNLDQVRRVDCRSLLEPVNDPDPSQFRSHEWLVGMHSKDGRSVLGFVHNEFHGHEHGYRPCDVTNRQDYACWYASTTLVKSEDGGRTFSRPPAPGNVLMSLPWQFTPGRKRAGVSLPKVVENPADGKVYVLSTAADRSRGIRGGQCLVRGSGTSLTDWEMWDGKSFVRYDANPYGCNGACTGRLGDCVPVLPGNYFSVRYIPDRKMFVALAIRLPNEVIYSLSPDLLNWSRPETLMETTLRTQHRPGDPAPGWYYSLLDPTSSSRNFDTLEKRPYLYFVRYPLEGDRPARRRTDVVRIPLRIE